MLLVSVLSSLLILIIAQDLAPVLDLVNEACDVSSRLLLIDTGLRVEHEEEVALIGDHCVQSLHGLYNDQSSISFIIASNLEKKNSLALQLVNLEDISSVSCFFSFSF